LSGLRESVYSVLPVGVQNLLCTVDGFRRSRHRFTSHFESTLAAWEASSNEPLELHHARQWTGLKELVLRARAVTDFYKDLPDPIEAADPRESMERTLAAMPVLEKDVYRTRTDEFLAKDLRSSQYMLRTTSGTTGTALRVQVSHKRFAENYAAVWRQRRSFGVSRDDPFLAFTGQVTTPIAQREAPFWRLDRYSSRLLMSIYHLSPEHLVSYIDPIHSFPARYVEGYPSALHVVGRAMIDAGRCLPEGKLLGIFTSSESLRPHQREAIETAFAAPVRDHYAATEHAVSMTACERNMLHVDMEFGIVEVEAQEETDDWVHGPLIVTGLGRPAVPFIRYRIGDVGTRLKRPCECGRPGDAFLDIDGRIEDYVVTPDDRLVGRMDHIFKGRLDIAEAQILQSDKDSIRVLVVPGIGWSSAKEHALVRDLQRRLGEGMDIKVDLRDTIPREANGKLRAVKSTINGSNI
jgi:phenylacetate-CoA ligase